MSFFVLFFELKSLLFDVKTNNLPLTLLDLNKIHVDPNISTLYPYIEIGLRIYLYCPISNSITE
jgi:hypothetical protein